MSGESYNGYGYNENGTERERDDLESNEYSRNDNPSYSTLDSYEEVAKQEEQEYLEAEEAEEKERNDNALETVREARAMIKDLSDKLDQIEKSVLKDLGAKTIASKDLPNRAENGEAKITNIEAPEKPENDEVRYINQNGLVSSEPWNTDEE